MMTWIVRGMIDRFEGFLGENLDYLRALVRGTPWIFWKFLGLVRLSAHRKHCPKNALHIARIAAAQVEDCGPCVQICVNVAQADNVPAPLIQTALDEPATLPEPVRMVYFFAQAIASHSERIEALRLEAEQVLGPNAIHDIAIAVASARVFPIIKRGMGLAQSCSIVRPHIQQSGGQG